MSNEENDRGEFKKYGEDKEKARSRQARYRERNLEKVRQSARESAAKRREDPEHRQMLAAQAAERRAADPEHHREINRRSAAKRRAEQPEVVREQARRGSTTYRNRLWAKDPRFVLWRNARERSKLFGCAFEITPEDITIPDVCPVFGTPLKYKGGWDAPSLDKIRPELGYVRGNIAVMSKRANVLKGNATSPEQLRRVADWLEGQLSVVPISVGTADMGLLNAGSDR